MSKGARIFINVLYYILTFGIGILIAVTTPAALTYSYSMKDIESALATEKYADAMMSVGGYYDTNYVFLSENKDLVIFSAMTLREDENKVYGTKVNKSYCGFYFNVPESYITAGNGEANQTRLMLTQKDDNQVKHNLIDYDFDQDGTVDSISTLVNYNFIFFEIQIEECASVKKLDFYDVNGNLSYSITFGEVLEYNEQFFIDVEPFIEEYNRDYTSAKLLELDETFRAKSSTYLKSSNGNLVNRVNKRVAIYVFLYFAAIYFIGDSLIGGRYIIKGIRFLFRKIFRRKQKETYQKSKPQQFVGVMYSNLTMELDVLEDFNKSVTISYSNEHESFEFYLVKEDGYKQTKRIKAGTYVNLKVLVDEDYEVIDPVEVLELKRLNEKQIIKIRRKEGVN